MPRATWNGVVLAESDAHELVEGNVYFPRSALRMEHFEPSPTTTTSGACRPVRPRHSSPESTTVTPTTATTISKL